MIPLYDPKLTTQKGNIYIVGDAAGQVKASTGGGIVPGLACAHALAGSIISRQDYEKRWRRAAGKELHAHLLIRKVLSRFSDKDYDRLVRVLKDEKTAFSRYGRDEAAKLLPRLVLRHPSLLLLARRLI